MLVLAIDTSSAAVTAAVVLVGDDVELVAGRVTVNARGHGEQLAPNVAACLREAQGEIGAVVVGDGPGPYTGLRVGLVTAAAFSDARGIPAYEVCSLDAMAPGAGPVLVATDARRKEVYWARYDEAGKRVDGPHVSRPDAVVTGDARCMAGAGARLYAGVIGLPLLDADHPSATALVARAADRVRSGAPSEPLTPRYLRHPDAVEPTGRKAVTR